MAKLKMTPSEALVETLVAEGVKDVFGIVGSAFMDFLDLFPAAGIRFIPVAHEQAACHAADGMARVTGDPQVCIGQNGPGIANFVSPMTAAFWAHSPVIAITPETGTKGIGTGGFQELDQMPMFEKSTVYQVRVNRPDRMAELARRCFHMAKNFNGPAQLNIPRDFFYGICEDEIYKTPRVSRGIGSKESLEQAAKLLASAKYPVILSGGGVSQADALAETRAVAEYLTAPVVNSYLHNDSFPQEHPLGCGPIGYCGSKAAMRTLAKADVVIALGCRLGPFGTLPQYDMAYFPENATLIQVDTNMEVLGLSRRVDVACCADVKEFAAELLRILQQLAPKREPNKDRLIQVAGEKDLWAKELKEWATAKETPRMHPRVFLEELAKAIPAGSMIATDIGNNSSMANSYFKFNGVRQHLSALSWGNCGFAMGTAMGAKVARPENASFAFQGDGAWGISGVQEVMTCVRENIPVVAVVANNREWGAEKKNQVDFYDNRYVGCNLEANPDFARVAESMGGKGITVTHKDQIQGAVEEALKSGKVCVINAEIQGGKDVLAEPFRRDALALPTRYLEKYQHLNLPKGKKLD